MTEDFESMNRDELLKKIPTQIKDKEIDAVKVAMEKEMKAMMGINEATREAGRDLAETQHHHVFSNLNCERVWPSSRCA
jgi:hypothetical protein